MTSTQQIAALETEAGQAGDTLTAALCEVAMYGELSERMSAALDDAERARIATFTQQAARVECERIIAASD
jgi:hypothetical protein